MRHGLLNSEKSAKADFSELPDQRGQARQSRLLTSSETALRDAPRSLRASSCKLLARVNRAE